MSAIGLRVGPFEIIEEASVPEAGDWYRAVRTGLTRRKPNRVLVKLLAPSADEAARASLQRELDNLRAVEDDRVPVAVALYEGIGALAIDASDGASFQDILDARRAQTVTMTPATLLDLGIEIAEALQHAHHRGRHHGHLCASHIRLSTGGKLVLFGFGPGPATPPSPDWMPPERARGEVSSPLTDQWSLAAILAGLITGHEPWHGSRDPRSGDCSTTIETIERQWPALARLFRRMLESDPANRYPSMHPVRQELLALARKAGATSARRELGKQMARRVEREITPDTEVPEELFVDEPSTPDVPATPEPAPDGPELPDAGPSETAMEPPTVPTPEDPLDAGDPPSASDPPSIPDAPRTTPAVVAKPHVPLIDEPLEVVAPELEPSGLLEARRPLEPVQEDEDTSDDPTVRFDPMLAKQLAALKTPAPAIERPTPSAHEDEAEEGDDLDEETADPQTLARALVAPPEDFGSMPTAVPITDVGDTPEPVQTPSTGPAVEAPIEAPFAIQDLDEAPRPSPDKEALDVRKLAPLLVGVMLLLMLAAVVVSLT